MVASSSNTVARHLYALSMGTLAGATVGVVGWGGGQIVIPGMSAPLPSVANYSQLAATGISLSSLSVSTLSTGYKFWHDNSVNVPLALAIGVPAVLSARMGSHLAKRLSGDALALFYNGFSIVLIPTHYWIQQRALHRKKSRSENVCADSAVELPNNVNNPDTTKAREDESMHFLQHTSYGLLSGTISALMGVGGLPLTISYITEATDLKHHHVQGTAVCALIPSILVSAFSRISFIPLGIASSVAFGAMVGGYGGAKVALDLTQDQLRYLYMTSLVVFGGRSMIGAARNIKQIYSAH